MQNQGQPRRIVLPSPNQPQSNYNQPVKGPRERKTSVVCRPLQDGENHQGPVNRSLNNNNGEKVMMANTRPSPSPNPALGQGKNQVLVILYSYPHLLGTI
jgi:hypothetical protein